MRRKSERAASKKAKSSPEKKEKVEKIKRTRTSRRRKQSTSSENDSAEESSPVQETEVVVESEKKTSQSLTKEESPEESQDCGEWHVKTAQSSSDTGEIQKLKICLTRPPSTPERTERSPRSKRKHSRATSSSDTASVEVVEEKKKTKHRSKRTTRDSKDDTEKNNDSQGDEAEVEAVAEKSTEEISQSMDFKPETATDETPVSTTNEEKKVEDDKSEETQGSQNEVEHNEKGYVDETTETQIPDKSSDADTTVSSPKIDHQMEIETQSIKEDSECKESPFVEKSEVLEINVQESKLEMSDVLASESQKNDSKAITTCHEKEEQSIKKEGQSDVKKEESVVKEKEAVEAEELVTKKVSNEDQSNKNMSEEAESSIKETIKVTNEHDVVASSETVVKKPMTVETAIEYAKDTEDFNEGCKQEQIDSTQSAQIQQEALHNGQAAPIVINRKRRWGLRANKLSSQKSITISTDVLKEIIPDVKPVEFDEVIEEKKSKREVVEKIERPVLPKIIIDNTEHAEQYRRENEEKDKENVKAKESYLAINRKISIVKENDNITARPPSPPRHKQSCILYITNLVRPFTLPQLKNLLQRTGRIVENGFWIDKIKSKCYVKYETEDQAVETRHALHGVTWPVSNPKTLQVDFSNEEAFEKAKVSDETESAPISTIPGTVEDWLREQDLKKERGEVEKPWERKMLMREWDVGKNDKEKEKDRLRRDERPLEKRRYRTPERSPEPARKFKKKEEEAPAKLLDDLFRKTKTTPCIYWLPLSAETIAIKEEQRRQHMAEHERRLQELRRERERRRH